MDFSYAITAILSLTILGVLFVHAMKGRVTAGAGSFIAQVSVVAVWTVASMLEMLSASPTEKLIWRHVQLVGVFGLPVTCLHFAVSYGRRTGWKRLLPLFWIVPIVALVLVGTDEAHQIIRENSRPGPQPLGTTLLFAATPAGILFLVYGFCLVLVSMIVLGIMARQVSGQARTQVILIMVSFFLVFAVAFIKVMFLERGAYDIPIVTLYLPGSLVLFYNLFWHKLFVVTPFARDKVFDVIEQGILVTDGLGVVVDRNPYAARLSGKFFGVTGNMVGKSLAEMFEGYPEWLELVHSHRAGDLEVQSPLADAGARFLRIKTYPLANERGKAIGMVSLLRDITARRLHEYELQTKADMDSLTGLLNRNGFLGAFHQMLENAGDGQGPVTVLMIDVDHFKHINDTYGHISGDRAMLRVAEVLRRTLRQQDAIGRIGGDEFAVALPGIGRGEGRSIAERILREVKAVGIEMENGEEVSVALSIGICDDNGLDGDADMLLSRADKALYAAKKQSRDCCVVWESDMGGTD